MLASLGWVGCRSTTTMPPSGLTLSPQPKFTHSISCTCFLSTWKTSASSDANCHLHGRCSCPAWAVVGRRMPSQSLHTALLRPHISRPYVAPHSTAPRASMPSLRPSLEIPLPLLSPVRPCTPPTTARLSVLSRTTSNRAGDRMPMGALSTRPSSHPPLRR